MNPYGAPEISPKDLKKRLDAGNKVLLLDVREPDEFDTVHMDGAVLTPLSELAQRRETALPEELGKDTETVVYCHHGGRSAQVVAWLKSQGYDNVKSLDGGIDQWSVQVDPKLPRY